MGPTSLSFILAVQHAVSWGQRGVATGAVIFLRTIGGAIGVGLLGATLGWELAHRLAVSGATGIDVAAALRPETHKRLSPAQLRLVQSNLGLTLRDVYLLITLLAIGSMICASGCRASSDARAFEADEEEGLTTTGSRWWPRSSENAAGLNRLANLLNRRRYSSMLCP